MDERTPTPTKLVIAIFILIYIISPIDIAPDIIPLIGLVDDFAIIPLIMWILLPNTVLTDARKYIQNQKEIKNQKKHWIRWILFSLAILCVVFLLYKSFGFDLRNEAPIIPKNL